MVRMSWRASASLTIITFAVSSVLLAQRVLVQLGLTDATARNFLLNEIKHPASSRRDTIVVTGNRAFLKLPPAARAQAASSLFAWIKGYVNSPTFKSAYSTPERCGWRTTQLGFLFVELALLQSTRPAKIQNLTSKSRTLFRRVSRLPIRLCTVPIFAS